VLFTGKATIEGKIRFYKLKIDRRVSRLHKSLFYRHFAVYCIHFRSARTSIFYLLYCTVPVTALQIPRSYLLRPRATTLYRTSQYISVLYSILYIFASVQSTTECTVLYCTSDRAANLKDLFSRSTVASLDCVTSC
jgi:hypothetical protein